MESPETFHTLLRDRLNAELPHVVDLTGRITNITRVIEGGARGDICMGDHNGESVGLKTLRIDGRSTSRRLVRYFVREVKIWMSLSHPNIVEFWGLYDQGEMGMAMVSPWMENGDLKQFLGKYPDLPRVPIVHDVIGGLSYLHGLSPPIVHGDLRTPNVFMRSSGQACLADFGFSGVLLHVQEEETSQSSASRGNPRWMAPERLDPEEYGMTPLTSLRPESDIYSLGMLILEIFTRRMPFSEFRNTRSIPAKVEAGIRPAFIESDASDADVWGGLWVVMQDCWKQDWRKRPLIEEVHRRVVSLSCANSLAYFNSARR